MFSQQLGWLKAWQITVLGQYGFAGLLLIVPFGFDHPSYWGLDFNHLVLALLVLAGLTLTAIAVAISERSVAGAALAAALPDFGWYFA